MANFLRNDSKSARDVQKTSKTARYGQFFIRNDLKCAHETSKTARYGQFFIRNDLKCAYETSKTARCGQLFILNDSKSAWDVQNSKTWSILSFETSQNVFLTSSIERRKVESAASQNSKIRSIFSFEMSKNEHEKCLLCRAFKNSNMQSTFCSFRHFTICFTLSDGKLTLPPILLNILLCLTCTFWWILKAKVDQMQSRSAHFDAKSWPHLAGLIGFWRILRIWPLNFVILGIRPLNSANLRIRPLN